MKSFLLTVSTLCLMLATVAHAGSYIITTSPEQDAVLAAEVRARADIQSEKELIDESVLRLVLRLRTIRAQADVNELINLFQTQPNRAKRDAAKALLRD
jgi:arginine/lysine/ornithine decarboxylase